MSIKNLFLIVFTSAGIASIACIVYDMLYSQAFYVDFSTVLTTGATLIGCFLGCSLMATAYYLGIKWKGEKTILWINLLIIILSFVSIIGILGFQLPFEIESPELFPGLAIPMHFFPALSFLAVVNPMMKVVVK
ncbi:MAG TPA: hypothetical protein VNW06_10955 [Cytophagaceae bacterium]|jgi:hypothetical protein|nr:hypothetical protein [Cytophagaceae bacterium]